MHGMGDARPFAAGDGLRALAAVSVLVFHVAILTSQTSSLLLGLNTGLFVFFVLSGYLLGGRYVRAWVLGTPFPRTRPFLVRRLRRIVPAFWLVALITLAVYGTVGTDWLRVLAHFAFLQTAFPSAFEFKMGQGWTLGAELSFYLALPVVALALVRLRARRVTDVRVRTALALLVLAAIGFASMKLYVKVDIEGTLGRSLLALLWAFLPGLALAAAEPVLAPLVAGRRWVAPALLAASVLAFLVVCGATLGSQVAQRTVATMVCAGGLVAAARAHEWATGGGWRLLTARPVQALGRWSYGIYLVHLLTLDLALELTGGFVPAAVLTLGLSVVAAAASWRWWERPWLEGTLPWERSVEVPTVVPAPAVATEA